MTKTKSDKINKNKVNNVDKSFGKNLSNKSTDTNHTSISRGAINPVIITSKSVASSGQGSALLIISEKNLWNNNNHQKNIISKLSSILKKVFIFSKILKKKEIINYQVHS